MRKRIILKNIEIVTLIALEAFYGNFLYSDLEFNCISV